MRATSMACTVITRRKFDPEATLDLIDRHRATGLAVVPVMFDRIMELPVERLLVSHGEPVLEDATARMAEALARRQ